MAEAEVRELHAPYGRRYEVCVVCATPYPCATIQALEANDPLATPLRLPQNEQGYWPGDPRFGVRVRSVYGTCVEQIVEASSLVDALEKALLIPLPKWLGERFLTEPEE